METMKQQFANEISEIGTNNFSYFIVIPEFRYQIVCFSFNQTILTSQNERQNLFQEAKSRRVIGEKRLREFSWMSEARRAE